MNKLFSANGYDFNFEYDSDYSIKYSRATFCRVYQGEKELGYCIGIALCNPVDNFKKSTGRKIALTKAINPLKLNKEQRKEVWDKYFEKVKK